MQRQCHQLDYHVHRWQRKFKKWENSNWGVAQKLHNIKCRIHFCSKISKHWSWSKKNFTSVDSWATILHILQVSTDAGMHMLCLKNLDPLQSPRAQFQKHPPSLLRGSSEELCVSPLWIYTHWFLMCVYGKCSRLHHASYLTCLFWQLPLYLIQLLGPSSFHWIQGSM